MALCRRMRRMLLLLGLLALGLAGLVTTAAPAPAQQQSILTTRVDGAITPVTAEHAVDALEAARSGGHQALLVEMDTPGGLDTSMRDIIKNFLGARVPVIVYVTPSGGRAASAGALITFSAHIAAMAPGTTIGAATPVDPQGGEISDKILNDAASYARSVAEQRGRNADFAEETVRKGRSVPADEAKELNAVDLVVPDRGALLSAVDGRTVSLAGGGEVTLQTKGAPVVEFEMGAFAKLRQLLADPNLAFLFMSIAMLAILYELANPGIGLGGIVGVVLLMLGLVALSVLPVNLAGVALLLLAAALFVTELFTPGVGVFAVGGVIALLLAGLFLFDGPFAVDPAVLWPVVIIVGAGALIAGRLALRARLSKPVSGIEGLIGQETVVQDVSADTGRAQVEGAWWTVRGRHGGLQVGQHVRVVAVQGLTLLVEPLPPGQEEEQ
ncbi:serine protease [Longimycelium tulufanense]|uniref:Serine protease n=1 Tax=Longimycelium tulufanense TaxID=907463 RepID=A0A8J3FUE0_9PSEU|nr:nodulation protein NfeD [Longimycelium tulufanense]GGM49847.1 serine protease [Longimycelium tulufanense]